MLSWWARHHRAAPVSTKRSLCVSVGLKILHEVFFVSVSESCSERSGWVGKTKRVFQSSQILLAPSPALEAPVFGGSALFLLPFRALKVVWFLAVFSSLSVFALSSSRVYSELIKGIDASCAAVCPACDRDWALLISIIFVNVIKMLMLMV